MTTPSTPEAPLTAAEHKRRCNILFFNLLSSRNTTIPSIYVRALSETERCDNVLGSLAHVRASY